MSKVLLLLSTCEERMVSWFLKLCWLLSVVALGGARVNGAIPSKTMRKIRAINKDGPYLGLVVPNAFELDPLLRSPSFAPNLNLTYLDFSGRRFRFGRVGNRKVIIVMTGLSMLNAGLATELLISLFEVKEVVHFGIAGNANSDYQIGDVVIPQYWAHTGLWNWQRYGDGPDDELAFESGGDYTRDLGYLKFSDFNNGTGNQNSSDNLLNNIWYQPEEIFPTNGIPEMRQHAFWVPADEHFLVVAKKLEDMMLEGCINTTCLPRAPMVFRVARGSSSNVLLDNAAYRGFVYSKFNVTPIDMESAAVALVCLQEGIPFIVLRALSDLAGGGSAESNEASTFAPLAAQNVVAVVVQFIELLSSMDATVIGYC